MNYAVIAIQGHQEIVSAQRKSLVVDKLDAPAKDIIKPTVLLVSIDGKVQIGTPSVAFPVELEVIKHQRGDKLYIEKFHAKARFRRRSGFCAEQTVLRVVKFGEETEKAVKSVKRAKPVKSRKIKAKK